MGRFTKRPVTIDAILASEVLDGATAGRFSRGSLKAGDTLMPDWIIKAFVGGVIGFELNTVLINTDGHGQVRAERTDWIIRGVNGELYPCKPDVFAKTYDEGEGALGVLTMKGDVSPEKLAALRNSMATAQQIARVPLIDASSPMLDAAWGIIANAGNGDWTTQTQEWQDAAAKWRDEYLAASSVNRVHAQEKAAVESGWVELSDQPPPRDRSDLVPAWELVIKDFTEKFLGRNSDPQAVSDVISDMTARDKTGRERYGVPLTAYNGRDQLVDGYQEALDLSVYLRAALEEGLPVQLAYNLALENLIYLRTVINGRARGAL